MAITAECKIALGNSLRTARKCCGISQRKAAQAVGKTNASLSDIENGYNFPSDELLLDLIKLFKPSDEKREAIFDLYAKAKGTPPLDILMFLKENPNIQMYLRQMMKENQERLEENK